MIRGSEVYWEAALDLFNIENDQEFCCDAIATALDLPTKEANRTEEIKLFTKYFKPGNKPHWITPWFGGWFPTVEDDNERLLAMLFMELIWEDEMGGK